MFKFFKKKKKENKTTNDDYIKEAELDGSASILNLDQISQIQSQIHKCICDIKLNISGHGTGFFCKIPFPDSFHLLPTLITNNHVLGDNDIKEGNKINISFNKKEIERTIIIDKSRKVYTNSFYDITFIELRDEDNFSEDQFLEIDGQINVENFDEQYKKKDVYIIGNIEKLSYGKIWTICIDNYEIRYKFNTQPGMSGSPIICLNNYKVMGIHKGANKSGKYNIGTFIREPIKEFNEKFGSLEANQKIKKKNENNCNKLLNDKNIDNKIDINNNKIDIDNNKIDVGDNKIDINDNKIDIDNNKIDIDNNKINNDNNKIIMDNFKNTINKIYIEDIAGNKQINDDEKKIILNQISKGICNIKNECNKFGIGFLCNVKFDSNIYGLLITYNHILGENDITQGKSIKFSLHNDSLNFEIILDDFRFIYTNADSDLTIIEIMEYDNLNKESFLEIDDNIFNNHLFSFFRHKSVYLLHYSEEEKEIIQTNGIIKSLESKNFLIQYNYDKSPNLLYGPIFDSKSYKIIAIHAGISETEDFKLGFLIKIPIEIFKEHLEKKKLHLEELKAEKLRNELIEKEVKEKNKLYKEEITIQYLVTREGKLRLFYSVFINNNKDKCLMVYNEELSFLKEYIEIDFNTILKDSSILEIKLRGIENITDLSYMFYECYNLYSLPDISKFNISNITNMEYMFSECNLLTSIPDISNLNTSNVTDMNHMFSKSQSLVAIPDISNWDTSKVTDMEKMFFDCKTIKTLPDISNWNTKNVENMGHMFTNCKSLESLPDISNWNTKNVTIMKSMFYGCESLKKFPDISKWNTKNVTTMKNMFYGCKLLESLPDLSKWNIEKVENKSNMFENCEKLERIPKLKESLKKKIFSFSKIAAKETLSFLDKLTEDDKDKDNDFYFSPSSYSDQSSD